MLASDDYRERLVGGGEAFGNRVGEYFQDRWGAEQGTAGRLASYWSGLASRAAESSESTSVRICYVKHPDFCELAIPSREIPGASWRRC